MHAYERGIIGFLYNITVVIWAFNINITGIKEIIKIEACPNAWRIDKLF